MSLSGRRQTLLSIYGAVNGDKKKPQRPHTSSTRVQQKGSAASGLRRPTPFVRTDSTERQDTDKGEAKRHTENQPTPSAVTPIASPPKPHKRHVQGSKEAGEPEPATPREGGRRTIAMTDENAVTIPKGATGIAATRDSAVISLYGDGFLEIPLSDISKDPEDADSSRLLGRSGFSIRMLLFKAADTEKHKTRVEADGARHKTPELDDSGDFVRWLCCGSTNRSVFGCFASLDEDSVVVRKPGGVSSVFRGPSESTPKLLSAKLRDESSEEDETTFSIYDRGVLPTYQEKGEDGGCRVRWRGLEGWVNNYEVPSNRWVHLQMVFDCRYLQLIFDDQLVDCARMERIQVSQNTEAQRGRRAGASSAWVQASSSSNSVYVGGHPSYAKSVRDWRARIGFVGLVSSFQLWKLPRDQLPVQRNSTSGSRELLVSLIVPEVGCVRDNSTFENVVNVHRNVFWRPHAPPIWTPISHTASAFSDVSTPTQGSVVLLANVFDEAHCDVRVASPKSFENLLLSIVQSGDTRVVIEYAAEFSVQRSHDHVCRSQAEYEQKVSLFIAGIEQMSHLLSVVVSSGESRPPIGFFEITMELTRAPGRNPIVVLLHSMNSTGCFPNVGDVKKKIESIVLFEAKRSPGEEIEIQAFRHLLALAGQTRHNKERIFIESVINRKVVLTERKVAAEFEKIGFFFASTELQEVVSYLKRIQDNYSRTHRHRMDHLPSLSMLSPTPTGLYTLPFLNTLLVSCTRMGDNGGSRSAWRFVCILVDYDFQLVDFIHEGCSVTTRGGISYRPGHSIYNAVVDRVHVRLTALSNKIFCVLFSLQKYIAEDEGSDPSDSETSLDVNQLSRVRIQIENTEEHHVLGIFEAKPNRGCRWFTLAAAYRSKKKNQWQLQAIGGCGNATSIYASIDEVNVLLAELRIIQTYEIRVYFIETGRDTETATTENREWEEFARRLAKNIRFGRNGRIVLVPIVANERLALKLQEVEHEIDVYTHRKSASRPLPTIQSVYRSLLRLLAQHGIKECVQQNPFVPQHKKVKRHAEFRVVSAQTNIPVENVHIFIEKHLTSDTLSSNLAKKVLPTLLMGSRLLSIRRRLQMKRVTAIIQDVAQTFVTNCIAQASKRATSALNLDVKLISVVRARALVRKVLRQRYEIIKGGIMERARKSDQARTYSQSVPSRLQKQFTNSLVLSESERDLLQHSTRQELAELDLVRRGIPVPFEKGNPIVDERVLLEEWKSNKTQFASEDHVQDNSKTDELNGQKPLDNSTISEEPIASLPEDPSTGMRKDQRQLFVSDSEGRTTCRLTPGSYSLYVYHLDYFEWTSLVAIYPPISVSGFSTGPTTATCSVQEIVIPLDVYQWTYELQLVDYFHPHIHIKVAGIPLQITANCSSERQVVTTDANGCATWEVSKGLYTVDVLRECSCVLYSAMKQVVVDGGRYRTSRTISMPVLLGDVKVTVIVATAVTKTDPTTSHVANIRFHAASSVGTIASAAVRKRRNATRSLDWTAKEERSDGQVSSVGSSRAFKLRLGAYRLEVTLANCFPLSLPAKVTWASSRVQAKDGNRYLAVLSPTISAERTFRVLVSNVDGVQSLDVILEVWKEETRIGQVWRQYSDGCVGHAELETVQSLEGCEYQSLLLHCQAGFTYKCIVASNRWMTPCSRPHVQIYSYAGLIYQCSEPPSIDDLYWHVCSWEANGSLISTNSSMSLAYLSFST